MIQLELLREMYFLTGLNDFLIILSNEYNPQDWGYYYPDNKVIVIYTLNEDGSKIDRDALIRICCHEVAHHIQYHHTKDYEVTDGEEHDDKFKEIFAKLLEKYYNGNIPIETIEVIREEGLLHEPNSKKKSRPKRASKRVRGTIYS